MADLSWISDNLTSGSRDSTGIVPGDLAPEDIIAMKVKELLEDDATVSGMVQSITRWPTLPLWEFHDLPALYVYNGSTLSEGRPTQCWEEQIDLFLGVVLKVDDMPAMTDWAPSLPSVIRAIRIVLHANKQLVDVVNDETVQLARDIRLGPVSWSLQERTAGTVTAILEFPVSYRVIVDSATSQIAEIVRALAIANEPSELVTQDGDTIVTQDGDTIVTQG